MPKTLCECGEKVFTQGVCYSCFREQDSYLPSPETIEAMKRQIRRENGHDPKQPRLFQAARH